MIVDIMLPHTLTIDVCTRVWWSANKKLSKLSIRTQMSAIQLASKPQVFVVGIHINCLTITWEVNSVFPSQSIIHGYLTFKPLYLSRDFELHFHGLSKECHVWRFVHIFIPKVKV